MDSWFKLLSVGSNINLAGEEKLFTVGDLKKIASSYDAENSPVPIVIGHPDTDSPAFGWIEALKVEGGKLLAKPKQIAEEFRDWLARGFLKKISVSLYPDLTLRHVGFLGEVPPVVKSLQDVRLRFTEKGKAINYISDFSFKEVEMSSSNIKDPGKEIQRRIKEVLRDPTRCVNKYGQRFSENITYGQAFTFVQQEDPELAREYFESLHPTKLTGSEKRSLDAGQKIVEFVNEKMRADKSLTYSEALTEVQKENRDLILVYIGRK